MRQSELFTKTRKEAPKDEVSKNAELLIKGGFIHKEMAGVYSYLPLGLAVLNKINGIIREEMNAIDGQELFLSSLQPKTLWEKTDRWDDKRVDNWFKTKLNNDTELGLGFTHEEPLTSILTEHISSYRDLPKYIYQIQTKFRNEARAKSGLIRTREFLMKDLYSFCKSEEEQKKFYEKAANAYEKIFSRVGIGDKTHMTFASGGIFSKYSHEFQTECEAGEDLIYVDEKKKIAINKEVLTDEVFSDLGLKKEGLIEKKTVEVGNIFNLGTRFSEPLGLVFKDEKGESRPVIMGSYGIGPGRLMGVVVEIFSDDKGIIWPEFISPFKAHILSIGESSEVQEEAEHIVGEFEKNDTEVLFDDRDISAGEKFADADLIGIPKRIVISEKTMLSKKAEVRDRKTGETTLVDIRKVFSKD
jgi:prolyl-tRNA synthetase